ncbi:TPA: TldD/PmbA family protein [candidate division WOR-3 bacterium]|jgi:TldD protein|uniref:TldD/PmbA family protein n=1 Tax=candidate division WOR-3 bacterium TaxID=2052148 RepID=A0A350H993_UNCW3|nr:TldD/PmbA family protein [candidate division WOR-3 bacterium]
MDKNEIIKTLRELDLNRGAQYADVRIEKTSYASIGISNHETTNAIEEVNVGAFIRVYNNGRWFYKSVSSIENLQRELDSLCSISKTHKGISLPIFDSISPSVSERFLYESKTKAISMAEKYSLLSSYDSLTKANQKIKVTQSNYIEKKSEMFFANSKNVLTNYDYLGYEIRISYRFSDNDKNFNDMYSVYSDDFSKLLSKEKDISDALFESETFLYANSCAPGVFPLILSPSTAGVFAHESFGHKSESDFMIGDENMKKEWALGKRVGSEKLSIIDYGDIPGNSGYTPFDDEGTKSQKTYLIKDGILTGRLHSLSTAFDLNEMPTGNGRAINFEFQPIVRMTNTYIEKGTSTFNSLVSSIDNGYFIKSIKHGSGLSTFTIAPLKAYKIKSGKITEPVKINVITGTIFETLNDIEGLSDELVLKSSLTGGCGKNEQYPLRVSFGGPFVFVKKMNVS